MILTKQAIWFLLALLALASFGWYFAHTKAPLGQDSLTFTASTDTVIQNLSVRQFDAQGHLTHYLYTPQLRHLPLNDTHVLDKPYVKVIQANQAPWQIHAEHAIASHGGKTIKFVEHVKIQQKLDLHQPAKLVETEELIYFPARKLAVTSKDIRFSQAQSQVTSTGMRAYIDKNHIKLLKNARGVYGTG